MIQWPEEFDGKVYQFQEGPTGEEGRIWQTKVKVKRVVRYQWHLNDLRRSHPKVKVTNFKPVEIQLKKIVFKNVEILTSWSRQL